MTGHGSGDPSGRLARLNTLSALGAAAAGLGLGALLAGPLAPFAWPILVGGTAVHLFGMVGRQRALGGQPSRWERAAYGLCWAVIAAVAAALAWALLRQL